MDFLFTGPVCFLKFNIVSGCIIRCFDFVF